MTGVVKRSYSPIPSGISAHQLLIVLFSSLFLFFHSLGQSIRLFGSVSPTLKMKPDHSHSRSNSRNTLCWWSDLHYIQSVKQHLNKTNEWTKHTRCHHLLKNISPFSCSNGPDNISSCFFLLIGKTGKTGFTNHSTFFWKPHFRRCFYRRLSWQ